MRPYRIQSRLVASVVSVGFWPLAGGSWLVLLLGEADAEGDAEGGVVHGEGGGAHERMIHIPVEVASYGEHTAESVVGTELDDVRHVAIGCLCEGFLDLANEHRGVIVRVLAAQGHSTARGKERILLFTALRLCSRALRCPTLDADELAEVIDLVIDPDGDFVAAVFDDLEGGEVEHQVSRLIPASIEAQTTLQGHLDPNEWSKRLTDRDLRDVVWRRGDTAHSIGTTSRIISGHLYVAHT